MDLQVLVVTADTQLGELVKAQVDNLGCVANVVETYDSATARFEWADAVVDDLVGDGAALLDRLRMEVPDLPVVAIAPDESSGEGARSSGARQVLVEPFSIAEIVDAVKAMGQGELVVVDLDAEATSDPVVDDKPWWATR